MPNPVKPWTIPDDTPSGLWRLTSSCLCEWSASIDRRSIFRDTLLAKLVMDDSVPVTGSYGMKSETGKERVEREKGGERGVDKIREVCIKRNGNGRYQIQDFLKILKIQHCFQDSKHFSKLRIFSKFSKFRIFSKINSLKIRNFLFPEIRIFSKFTIRDFSKKLNFL